MVLGLVASVLALCPTPNEVSAELASNGVTLAPTLKIVLVELADGRVELSLFEGDTRYDARVLEGDDCQARTRSAAAFVAGWSAELSQALDAPVLRKRRVGKRPPRVTVLHRITPEAVVTFTVTGVGFQGVLDYTLSAGPGVFSLGGFVSLTPDVVLPTGVLSRSTFGGVLAIGGEGISRSVAFAGNVGLLLGGSIVQGPDPSALSPFELGVRFCFRIRWTQLRFLPGLTLAGTLWPARQGERVQVVMEPSPIPAWELGVGAHLAIFP